MTRPEEIFSLRKRLRILEEQEEKEFSKELDDDDDTKDIIFIMEIYENKKKYEDLEKSMKNYETSYDLRKLSKYLDSCNEIIENCCSHYYYHWTDDSFKNNNCFEENTKIHKKTKKTVENITDRIMHLISKYNWIKKH